ncbi:NAD(P)H-dependent oxidoreductase [Lentzea sp. NBC_00516]|jgi:FMN-dependent NADH-azoreductase|uniref:FMN dependent NADH:quinone oxidoreductase n=1 Tax=Lentzea sokolovensis TaxID=3095429 RepID=A0ABU4VDL7_9PSEU|nr:MULTISPECIES: NAD(P)H-dependent oxidoreductase [unclassified Lentzea]MDX8149859.1 NAD(P)H-dependent oxidoreductase [Lentzea sp. BCCO 10_0061]WUD21363.1 NAD(P)H-dependent oxidoreductase [Lentzea sp. NBC_00516]
MTNLLHIDTSIRYEGSVTREISNAFAESWRAANPGSGYTYRDLHASPIPHKDGTDQGIAAGLIAEVDAADVLLIGAPMYNFSIPSTLKAWIDQVATSEHFAREDGTFAWGGKRVVVVTARGGSYKPGTPREGFDFQEPYLRAVLSMVGLDQNLEFVHAELTLADVVPQMHQFRELAVESLADAHRVVKELASA